MFPHSSLFFLHPWAIPPTYDWTQRSQVNQRHSSILLFLQIYWSSLLASSSHPLYKAPSLSLKQPNSQHLPFCQGVVLPFSLSLFKNVLKSRLHVPETFYPFHAISCLSPPHFAENILGIGHHRLLEPNSLFSPYPVRGLSHCTLPTTVFFNTPPAHVRLLLGVSPMCMWVSLSVSFMVFSSIVFFHLWGLKKLFFCN